MKLFIDATADATKSQVNSLQNGEEAPLPVAHIGDILELQCTFVNGSGGYSSFTGRADIVLNAGIGEVVARTPYTVTQTMNKMSDYYSVEIDLGTEEMKNAIGTEETMELDFEVQVCKYPEATKTLLQKKILIRNELIKEYRIAKPVSNLEAERI